jgi:Tfp pilus assembly protein PilN
MSNLLVIVLLVGAVLFLIVLLAFVGFTIATIAMLKRENKAADEIEKDIQERAKDDPSVSTRMLTTKEFLTLKTEGAVILEDGTQIIDESRKWSK